jgi:hypothetical protein
MDNSSHELNSTNDTHDHHTEHNFYSVLNKCTNFPANICHNLSWEAKRSFHKNICTCFDPTWLSLNLLVVAKRKWIRMSIICGVQFMAWIIHTPHIVMTWLYYHLLNTCRYSLIIYFNCPLHIYCCWLVSWEWISHSNITSKAKPFMWEVIWSPFRARHINVYRRCVKMMAIINENMFVLSYWT